MLTVICYLMINELIYITSDKYVWKEIKMNMDAGINIHWIFLFTRHLMSVFTISYFSRLKDT